MKSFALLPLVAASLLMSCSTPQSSFRHPASDEGGEFVLKSKGEVSSDINISLEHGKLHTLKQLGTEVFIELESSSDIYCTDHYQAPQKGKNIVHNFSTGYYYINCKNEGSSDAVVRYKLTKKSASHNLDHYGITNLVGQDKQRILDQLNFVAKSSNGLHWYQVKEYRDLLGFKKRRIELDLSEESSFEIDLEDSHYLEISNPTAEILTRKFFRTKKYGLRGSDDGANKKFIAPQYRKYQFICTSKNKNYSVFEGSNSSDENAYGKLSCRVNIPKKGDKHLKGKVSFDLFLVSKADFRKRAQELYEKSWTGVEEALAEAVDKEFKALSIGLKKKISHFTKQKEDDHLFPFPLKISKESDETFFRVYFMPKILEGWNQRGLMMELGYDVHIELNISKDGNITNLPLAEYPLYTIKTNKVLNNAMEVKKLSHELRFDFHNLLATLEALKEVSTGQVVEIEKMNSFVSQLKGRESAHKGKYPIEMKRVISGFCTSEGANSRKNTHAFAKYAYVASSTANMTYHGFFLKEGKEPMNVLVKPLPNVESGETGKDLFCYPEQGSERRIIELMK